MEASIVAVIGTLLGTVLGVVGAYVNQSVRHDREAAERLNAIRREVYVEWLRCSHTIYQTVKTAWGGRPTPPPEQRRQELQKISPLEAQAALEALRLVASDDVAVTAAAIWQHLRQRRVAINGDGEKADYKAWQAKYWLLRREFVDSARVEVGLAPLDWARAGVSPWRKGR